MGWEAPIKTDISVAVMEATLQKKKINTMCLRFVFNEKKPLLVC